MRIDERTTAAPAPAGARVGESGATGPGRRRQVLGAVLAVASLAAASPVAADPLDVAGRAFSEGRFIEAADLAEAAGGAQGLVLAAEALAVQAFHLAAEEDRPALFDRAIGLAARAIETDPEMASAHVMSARAMGYHGQTISASEAQNLGYAKKIRDALARALALDPGSVEALTGMAVWHARVVDAAGSFLARLLYGASKKKAHALFGKALERAPAEKTALVEYAHALPYLDGDPDHVRRVLRKALALPARDAYERIVDERASALLAELDAGGG